jgi:hypothetical protein
MRRVTLLAPLVALTVGSAANADIVPNPVEACGILPVGSPCTIQGREEGSCIQSGSNPVCQIKVAPSSVPPPLPTTSAPSPLHQPSSPRSGGGCSVAAGVSPDLLFVSILLLLGFGSLGYLDDLVYRATQRRKRG